MPAYCPYRKSNAKSLLNQLAHRFSSPKIEGKSQLFRVMVHHCLSNLGGLPAKERSPLRTAPSLCLQRFLTSLAKLLHPLTDILAGYTPHLSRLQLTLSIQDGGDLLLP